jgi:tRNA threonylcarbamoyladenosine modification (KEOPS) complex  Pcc1 subunit
MNTQAVLATIRMDLKEELLRVIETALNPEVESPSSERSETSVLVVDGQLVIQTRASDTTALRASLNSYLRWIEGIQDIVASIE